MNILEVAQGLHAKAADDSTRSKASRLREVIDSVETALNAGVSRSEVIKELSSHGLVFTLRTFETTLGRIREKRKRNTEHNAPSIAHSRSTETAFTQPQVNQTSERESRQANSHSPVALDRIISSKPDLAALTKIGKRIKQ